MPKEKVFFKALEPEGGASDVGESIKHYTESNNINVAIMGARGQSVHFSVVHFIGVFGF